MSLELITTEEHFNQILQQNENVVVDFFAPWCGPCKMLSPMLDQLSEIVGDKIKIVKINVDDKATESLTKKYNVRNIPTLIKFKQGVPTITKVGASTKVELIKFLGE